MRGRFSIKTLGCKMNQHESGVIASSLLEKGWVQAEFGEPCDIVIVNTCTVTDNSDRKCRNYIRQAGKRSGGARVYVTGCLAERDGESVKAIEGVAGVYGNSRKGNLLEDLDAGASRAPAVVEGRTRASLKIQDGCDGKCSYCIVPTVRGKGVSRSSREIIDEAKALIDYNIPEIVLTGITIGSYNFEGDDLASLAEKIVSLEGDFRLRITSVEPMHVTDRLAALFLHPKICQHIHLPLQSGSDRILSIMNRPYSRSEFLERVAKIRAVNPDISIGSDVIVAFPGETDEDFSDTISLVDEAGFSYLHQFTFSRRKGTPASQFAEVHSAVADERSAELKCLAERKKAQYRARFVGKKLSAVIEPYGTDYCMALTGNYIHVKIPFVKFCRADIIMTSAGELSEGVLA